MAGMRGDRWDEPGESISGGRWDRRFVDEVDGGVTLVPQSAGQWAIALVMLAFLVGGVGGVYWNSVSRQASVDEAASVSMAELKVASQSAASGQSSGGVFLGEMPMSGRYPIGPDGKLLRPKDAQKPELPAKPENMRFESKEGMEAFSKYFVELIPYTWLSGSTKELKAISSSSCSYCTSFVSKADEVYMNGGWVEASSAEIISMTDPVRVDESQHLWRSDITVYFPPMHAFNGKEELTSKEQTTVFRLQAQFTEEGWVIDGIGGKDPHQ